MRCLFESQLTNPAFGDPGLYVDPYTRNVVFRYDELVLDVHEIGIDGRGRSARFSSRTNFVRESTTSFALDSDVVHDEATFRVRARFVDHDIPCLSYVVQGQKIGYATDLRYTEANVATLAELFAGADVLFIECVFLREDAGHGARKNHLTAGQAGHIARLAGAKAVRPFHFSPRYEGREAELIAELEAAWRGEQTMAI